MRSSITAVPVVSRSLFLKLNYSCNLGSVIEPYVNNTTHTSVLQVRKEFFSSLLGKANSEEFHASTGTFLYAIFSACKSYAFSIRPDVEVRSPNSSG